MNTPLLLAAAELDAGAISAIIPIVAIVFGCLVGIIAVIATNARKTKERKHREESRREIAAYVAEGSLSVDQAEKLMAAGEPVPGKDDKCGW